MNDRVVKHLLRSEVAKLPDNKQRLYQFIIDLEDKLAEKASTADEFRRLLLQNSPFELAVQRFKLPYEQVVRLMNEIEAELNEKVNIRYNNMKWIDYSSVFSHSSDEEGEKRVFLFIN